MAWFAYVAAAASAIQGQQQKVASDYNAAVMQNEAKSSMRQTAVAEGVQRRSAREILGREAAAISQGGTGMTGSSTDLLDQSAANAELDALNVRYRGQLAAYGMQTQSDLDTQSGKNAMTAGFLNAGASYLRGSSKYSG